MSNNRSTHDSNELDLKKENQVSDNDSQIAQEAAQEAAQETAHDKAQQAANDTARVTTHDKAHETTQQAAHGSAQETAQQAAQETTIDKANNTAHDILQIDSTEDEQELDAKISLVAKEMHEQFIPPKPVVQEVLCKVSDSSTMSPTKKRSFSQRQFAIAASLILVVVAGVVAANFGGTILRGIFNNTNQSSLLIESNDTGESDVLTDPFANATAIVTPVNYHDIYQSLLAKSLVGPFESSPNRSTSSFPDSADGSSGSSLSLMEESVANIAAPTNSAADAAAGSSTSAATPPQAAIAGGASDSASSGTGASSSASSGTGASDSASSGTGASGSESSMSPSGSAASSSASPEIAPGSSMTQKSTADLGTTLDSNATADHSFSTTNTQVEGIDEADIIKTDGKNIYIVVDDEVVIVKADGTETSELSRMKFIDTPVELYITNDIMIVLTNGTSKAKSGSKAISTRTLFYDVANAAKPVKLAEYGQDGSYNSSRLNNDVLYLISRYFVDTNKMREDDPATYMPKIYDGDQYVDAIPLDAICIFPDYNSSAYTIITTYSLASNNVEKIGELAYLGASETLYMSEGNLYLTGQISGYEYSPMLGRETSAVDPEMLGTTDAAAALSESHASAAPGVSSVVEPEMSGGPDVSSATEPEMSGGSAKDSIEPVAPATTDAAAAPSESPVAEPAMSGGSGVSSASSASWAGDVSYVGNEYKVRQKTSIVRIALNNGNIAMAAETVVPGYLLNQFSLDEYQGYLRAAFNNVNSGVNEAGEFKYDLYNSLLVLDQDLGLVGSLSGLGKDESIYSVRFAGTVGYIVTFRQTDPLFSIDLSDPANPKVMDALKIPGFSEYLHPYADGLLLGIGKDTNGIGSLSGYLKISMFDTSDPYNIVEKSKELIDAFSAEALSNHKSVLIDAQKNIIGFSVQSYSVSAFADDVVKQGATANMSSSVLLNDSGGLYLIYGYSKNGGFYKRAAVVLPEAYTSTRALFIDDYLYIVCGQDIAVCKMSDLDKVKDLDGDDVFTWISVRSKELQ